MSYRLKSDNEDVKTKNHDLLAAMLTYFSKTLYLPRVRTIGQMQSLVKDILKLRLTTGWKLRRRG